MADTDAAAARLLVISSCTGLKAQSSPHELTQDDFQNADRLAARESGLSRHVRPAGEMYTGQQHIKMMTGVGAIRARFGPEAVTLRIVSAGYGLIDENRPIAPYNVTFSGMGKGAIHDWARHLGVPQAVRSALGNFGLVIFLLGSDYLTAIDPPLEPRAGQRLVFLAKQGESQRLTRRGVTVVPLGKPETAEFGAGFVSLKGRVFQLFAESVATRGWDTVESVHRDDTAQSFMRAVRGQTIS